MAILRNEIVKELIILNNKTLFKDIKGEPMVMVHRKTTTVYEDEKKGFVFLDCEYDPYYDLSIHFWFGTLWTFSEFWDLKLPYKSAKIESMVTEETRPSLMFHKFGINIKIFGSPEFAEKEFKLPNGETWVFPKKENGHEYTLFVLEDTSK